jgi:hypothetical protein
VGRTGEVTGVWPRKLFDFKHHLLEKEADFLLRAAILRLKFNYPG